MALVGCSAAISTLPSPAHPRVVEIRNDTDETRVLKIEPAAHQSLGYGTTFSGRLRPGEVKVFYLYDGFTYRFRVIDATGVVGEVRRELDVSRDLDLAYAGDSLVQEGAPSVEIGRPTVLFSESYDGYTEARLDSVFAMLEPLMGRDAGAVYRGLDTEAKREFLLALWARRDPTPGTPANEFRDEVEGRLATVEAEFRSPAERGPATPRGRIWLRHGKPDRRVIRRLESGFAAPYEIWVYDRTGYSYVFLDELRNGRYVLLTGSDPQEAGRPNWDASLPEEAVGEILREAGLGAGAPR